MEEELMKSDEDFDKSKVAFQLARLQQLYIEARFYLANKGLA